MLKLVNCNILVVFLFLSFFSCSNRDISPNTDVNIFLFAYLQNSPTIKFDTSRNVVRRRISYINFDKREIFHGDDDSRSEWYDVILFQNGIFHGLETVRINDGIVTRYSVVTFINNADGSIIVKEFEIMANKISRRHIFNRNDSIFIANERVKDGRPASIIVIIEEGIEYLFFRNHLDYARNLPAMRVIFENGYTTIHSYSSGITYFHKDGILMRAEFADGRRHIYSVSSGIGEVIMTDTTGAILFQGSLERKLDDNGFLIYQAVRFQQGEGYEWFITQDSF